MSWLNQWVLLLLAFLIAPIIHSQDLPYVRKVIDTLSSPGMHGRGYVKEGDKLAASFIADEFRKFNLKAPLENYQQHFSIPVNTFPGNISLKLNGEQLVPGEDYLVHPASPSINGSFDIIAVNGKSLLQSQKWISSIQSAKNNFLILDLSSLQAPEKERIREIIHFLQLSQDISLVGIIIISDDKLVWHSSRSLHVRPTFRLNKKLAIDTLESVSAVIENRYYDSYTTQNVIAVINGMKYPDSLIVFTAHYDHLGRMGKETYFPGANDNASGVALMLNLAKHYKINPPNYSMAFIAFGGEELGLLGSLHFVQHPVFPLENISFLINFDISGTGDDGIQVVNGTVFEKEFGLLKKINLSKDLLPKIKVRGEACNSDHCPFYRRGIPSFYIYTLGGIQAYHDIFDRSETLPLTEYEDYFKLLTLFINQITLSGKW